MQKTYNFKEFEDKIDSLWYEAGVSSPEFNKEKKDKEPFVVVIPPPNVTGILHMGHALNNNIQDTVSRYKRMNGHPTVWVPGTDHAGIATQQVMERRLKEEGKSRADLGRDKFITKTYELAENHKQEIMKQLRKMGASCDWSRERFTLDEGLSQSVREVFVTLYERGLIYRGDYLVNWSVGAGTALSDDEVEYKEVQGNLYHICYPFVDKNVSFTHADGNVTQGLVVATTRPETMLGDVAVAVHPDDERYKHLVGKQLQLPLTDRTIPIIADEYVKSEFGSGAVKITPAHDPNDYKIGKRHNLKFIAILDVNGCLNKNAGIVYEGLSVKEARKKVCADLENGNFLLKKEAHTHQVGHCYRTGTVVEPMISTQWFVKMDGMAQKALQAWKDGKIKFYPKHWENTFVHWLENIRDWCISRQLWWGHRIPVWYNDETGEVIVSREDPKDENLRQETDVLDTWFSSWLWPFSVFGWPENTADLQKYYPTSTLITAYDIIFFWVARMIMAGLEFKNEVPFKDIYIHGLVRDDKGRKMSKSLGNGIDPRKIIDLYGADALKFTLIFLCKLGSDVLINEDKFQLGSRFCNKVWNASRFVLMSLESIKIDSAIANAEHIDITKLNLIDKWIVSKFYNTVELVHKAMNMYRLDEAAKEVYEYFWSDFCDWYVEASKDKLYGNDDSEKTRVASILLWLLRETMKLLHPFIPFITEEIYSHISNVTGEKNVLLAGLDFPSPLSDMSFQNEERLFSLLQELVVGVRTLRSEFNLPPKLKIDFSINIENEELQSYFETHVSIIKNLTNTQDIFFNKTVDKTNTLGVEGTGFVAFVYIKDFIDVEKEKERLLKRKEKDQKQLDSIHVRLKNEKFISNAAPEYVEEVKKQAKDLEEKIIKITNFYEQLT